MAWKTVTQPGASRLRRKRKVNMQGYGGDNSWSGTIDNFNMIQQVYRGRYDRLERYKLYDWMDQDSDIARALDLIAEHCTEKNDEKHFFEFDWAVEPTEEESAIIQENLSQWSKVNEWDNRLFRIVRNVIKYGDWFLFRNPDTHELYTVHPKFVLGALVDRERLEIVAWIVRNFNFNVEHLELSVDNQGLQDRIRNMSINSGLRNTRVIPSIHMMHLSLSEGKFAGSQADDDPSDRYNNRWPFGESWLEQASKTFKQRELLEDSVLIHRVQRAPSRTVWYIDTGKMRPDRASWVVHNFKNELNQKRIPQLLGGEQKSVDSVYNPISQLEDIYIPVAFDQRGSKVETLEGQPWNELPDLVHFSKKMLSALRVPRSWMVGPDEGGAIFNDQRVGVAYQEEIEFSRMCTRFQKSMQNEFDWEFKLYNERRDVNVNPSDYDMVFVEPDNYEDYKRNARDNDNIGVWSAVKDDPRIAARTGFIKYLNWSEDEVVENERRLVEERGSLEDAGKADDLFGGGAPVGGAVPPPLGGEAPLGSLGGGPGEIPGEIAAGGFSDMGAGMGGGDMAAAGMGGGLTAGRDLDAEMKGKRLDEITAKDIQPRPSKEIKYIDQETPDDDLFMAPNARYGGQDALHGKVIATLKMIKDIRQSNFSRRVENRKRLKVMQKLYKVGGEEEGGLGGGGLGGGLGF